jgi:MFS transporter, putative metabolite:H+ symporter
MTSPNEVSVAQVVARIERLPMTGFHIRTRLIVGTATFFDALDALTIAYVLPVLIPLWQLNGTEIGALISIGFIGQMVGSVLFGWMGERWGRIVSLTWSVLIFSVFSILCAFAWNYPSLFIFRTLQGLGLGGEVPVAATYINEISKARGRGFFVMIYEFAFNVGLFCAAVLGNLMVPHLGWQSIFLVGALPSILIIFMRRHLPESPRWLASRGRLVEADQVVTRIEEEACRAGKALPAIDLKPVSERKTDWRELFQGIYRRRTLTVWVIWVTTYFVTYGLLTWAPTLYSTVFKLSLEESLRLPLLTQLVSVLTGLFAAVLIDRIGRRLWFTGAFFLTALPLLVLWLLGASSVWQVWWLVTIAAWFISTNAGVLYLYSPELYPTRMRALGSSMAAVWVRVASAVGPLVTGAVLTNYSLAGVFLVMGAVPLIGAGVAYIFAEESGNKTLEEVSP